jgi:two-component system, chemotaxis family, sensor kinase Cph1
MFTLNKNGIILDVNLTGALLLGVEEGNLRNQAFIKYIDPDYHQKFHIHCLKAKKTNKKQILDVKLLTKNNDAVYVHLETISVTNETQELQEFQVTMVDITEQEKASKEIEFANKYNRSLIEASLDPLVTIGADGMITDLNKCTEKITGYSRDELIGTNFLDYITEPEKVQEEYPRLFDVGSVKDYPLEIKNKNKNGNLTPVLYNASVYKDEKGNVIGVFAAARDITQIKNTQQKLQEYQDKLEDKVEKRTKELARSNAELEHFAYVASHDLREPLRMITSFLQLLEWRYGDQLDSDANEFIQYAVEGAKNLNDMINDLLEYSKVSSKEPVLIPVSLENVLENALINLVIHIKEKNAVVDHDPLPNVNGDDKLLTILLQNLIGNAIKYNDKKPPKIHISSKTEANNYVISVEDNGIGIKPEYLERIFTIFQRLHSKEEYEGTGIGLTIAQKIVHQHHGEIWVESIYGKGTTFYFTIPRN